MQVEFEYLDGTRSAVEIEAAASVGDAVRALAELHGFDIREAAAALGVADEQLLEPAVNLGKTARVGRVVIELKFESEHATHPFAPGQKWQAVFEWACDRFNVAADARPNLELRDGTPTGGVLSDDVEIGSTQHKRTVWLVKPGPEPYGTRDPRR